MKLKSRLAIITIFAFLFGLAFSQEPKRADIILIEAQIEAANNHYKSVLIAIADRKLNIVSLKDPAQIAQANKEISVYFADSKNTEMQIRGLVNQYNAALQKK